MPADPAMEFWLHVVEAEGGLHEDAGDQVIAVLPDGLRAAMGLPEEVAVTVDPEVAREDGALLLLPGHPVLDAAAEHVLSEGDGGIAWGPWPASVLPAPEALLERARARFDVDHGRLDLGGTPAQVYLPVLRVGALASYSVGLSDRFQEREEAWVDARTGLPLPEDALARVASQVLLPAADTSHGVAVADLPLALREANALLEHRALARRDTLARQAARSVQDELGRIDAYYDAALSSIARRRESATADRQQLLDAQAATTRVEHARRRQEAHDKFRPDHRLQPFRLHLVLIPAVDLPVHVRRGARTYPFTVTWILPRAGFVAARCPSCHAAEPLIAGRDQLGCRACMRSSQATATTPAQPPSDSGGGPEQPDRSAAAPSRHPTPEPTSKPQPAPDAEPLPKPAVAAPRSATTTGKVGRAGRPATPSRPRPTTSRPRTVEQRPERVERAGNQLGHAFWQAAGGGQRWPRKKLLPGSPLAVVYRLYGNEGPVCAIGAPPGVPLVSVSMGTPTAIPWQPWVTSGQVELADGGSHPYTLRWRMQAGKPAVEEVLPLVDAVGPALAPLAAFPPAVAGRLGEHVPSTLLALDPVAALLWKVGPRHLGLPATVRCLAAWWRLPVLAQPTDPPPVIAAAITALVCEFACLRDPDGTVTRAFGADPTALTSMINRLQQHLGLSIEQPW